MADALAGVLLFLLGYFFCKYRDGFTAKPTDTVPVTEEEKLEVKRQTEQLRAFHTMMDYDESTAYGGVADE